jgi:DNA-directed RNA polymerase subunit RPC12/RpoP
MAQTTKLFKCPGCGAPLEPPAGETTMRCIYCGNSVIIPKDLRSTPRMDGFESSDGGMDLNQLLGEGLQLAEVQRLIQTDNKIEAIKRYREITGVGLKEAKDAVDAMEAGQSIRIGQNVSVATMRPRASQTVRVPQSAYNWIGCVIFLFVAGILASVFVPILFALPALGALVGVVNSAEDQVGAISTTVADLPNPAMPTATPSFAQAIFSFGEEGSGAGMFDDPRYVGVDRDGNIFVGDYGDGRVQVFDPQGRFLRLINLGENYVMGMAVAPDGTLYLSYSGDIHVFDPTGQEINKGDYGHNLGKIALGADGSLYAVSSSEDIIRYGPDGKQNLTITDAFSSITNDSELDVILAVDGLGKIYALGTFNNLVLIYGPDGKFIDRFGGDTTKAAQGVDPGHFQAADTIAVDGYGRIYVSDIWGIQVFNADGQYLDFIDLESGVAFGMAFDLQNNFYIASNVPTIYKMTIQKP